MVPPEGRDTVNPRSGPVPSYPDESLGDADLITQGWITVVAGYASGSLSCTDTRNYEDDDANSHIYVLTNALLKFLAQQV